MHPAIYPQPQFWVRAGTPAPYKVDTAGFLALQQKMLPTPVIDKNINITQVYTTKFC